MFGEVGVGDGLSEWTVVGVRHVGLHGFTQVVRFLGDVVVVSGGFQGPLEGHPSGGRTPSCALYALP